MKKIEKLPLPLLGFLQSTALLIYISLIASFMFNANKIFGKVDTFFAPIAFLLLFVVSAIISGLLVLGRAGFLFWEKKYNQAFTLLGWTIGFLILYLLSAFLILYLFK